MPVKSIRVQVLNAAAQRDTHAYLRWAFCLLLDEFQGDGCSLQALAASAYRLYHASMDEARDLAYELVSLGFATVEDLAGATLFKRNEKCEKLCAYLIDAPDNIARPATRYY